jgi:hypothetical protein
MRAGRIDLPGSAHLVLSDQVAFLDPAASTFEAMLDGWVASNGSGF